ncbi:MAG: uncharacterized protein JWM74_4082 [Myxococcaceae bacterium]|nr:uncharacterized protein [Myxococcaceae bacterium]
MPTHSAKSGSVALVKAVRAFFEDSQITAKVSLGWKERAKQDNQGAGGANRVVFTPSDDSGAGGRITAVRGVGDRLDGDLAAGTAESRRGLFNWERIFLVSVWAVDTSTLNDPENEEAQIEAVELLFEHVMQAVQAFAGQTAKWGDVRWTVTPLERTFGRELRASLQFKHPMFDEKYAVVKPSPAVHRQ